MAKKSTDTPVAVNFETALGELQTIVQSLEQNDLPLEEALTAFEKGIGLTSQCQQQLNNAEQRVSQLIEKNGELGLAPFDRAHDE